MPKKPKNAIVQPVFKRPLDRTLSAGELEVFGTNSDHLENLSNGRRKELETLKGGISEALGDLRRDGTLLKTITPAEALRLTCEAAEQALWIALGVMQQVELERFGRRFYTKNAEDLQHLDGSEEEQTDEERERLAKRRYGKAAYLRDKSAHGGDVTESRPLRVDEHIAAIASESQNIGVAITEIRSTLIYLRKTGKLATYLKNSDISTEEMRLAKSFLEELIEKIDGDDFFHLAGLLESVSPRRETLEDGRRGRIFERHYVLQLFPLWIVLTGKTPRDRDHKFIDLISATYRCFAFDPCELEAEIALQPEKAGEVALWEWTTPLEWAAAEFRKTHLRSDGGFPEDTR